MNSVHLFDQSHTSKENYSQWCIGYITSLLTFHRFSLPSSEPLVSTHFTVVIGNEAVLFSTGGDLWWEVNKLGHYSLLNCESSFTNLRLPSEKYLLFNKVSSHLTAQLMHHIVRNYNLHPHTLSKRGANPVNLVWLQSTFSLVLTERRPVNSRATEHIRTSWQKDGDSKVNPHGSNVQVSLGKTQNPLINLNGGTWAPLMMPCAW